MLDVEKFKKTEIGNPRNINECLIGTFNKCSDLKISYLEDSPTHSLLKKYEVKLLFPAKENIDEKQFDFFSGQKCQPTKEYKEQVKAEFLEEFLQQVLV